MPVRKLRDIAEASPPVGEPLEGENVRSAFELSELCRRLHPWITPRGVHRYRSLEERARPE